MKTWRVILALVSACALTAAAQPNGPRGNAPNDAGRGMPRGVNLSRLVKNERLLNSLNLSEAQVNALKERAATSQKKIADLRDAIEKAEADVRSLMQADTLDREAVMKAVDKAGQIRTDLRKVHIEDQFAISEIAGPDALRELREQRQRQNMERRSDRGPRRDGERPGMMGRRGPAADDLESEEP
ncbi:MAG: periplasmic heavy metal sensor [Kiritimatiellae bacterium]|nr:periplasmic heavy metal sensor [Kiritimatiellia bacterium]